MENKNNKSIFTLTSMFSLLLLVMLTIIVFFMLFSVMKITESLILVPTIVFVCINLAIIYSLTFYSKKITEAIGIPFFIGLIFTTFVYSILQFIILFISVDATKITGYMLFNMFILFIFFLINIPIVMMGINNNKSNEMMRGGN